MKSRPPSQTNTQQENAQAVKAEIHVLGRLQGYGLRGQGLVQENQGAAGAELGWGREE